MKTQEPITPHLALLICLAFVCMVCVEGFTPQLIWANQSLPNLALEPHSSSLPYVPVEIEEERPTITEVPIEKEPYFASAPVNTVITRVGRPAVLTCTVKNLGNRQVTWIRGRDLHVLSSGQVTFSSDERISVSHYDNSWTLTIKFSQPRDAGPYSCQINTQPPLVARYNLTVIEAKATMLGKETLYVQSGSTVSLQCVIKEQLAIPGLVLWYQNDHLVERQSSRITVNTTVTNVTTSTLTVEATKPKDSGNYSCWPSAGRPDSAIVHVIQGDPPAAMQHGSSAPGACPFLLVPMILTSLMFLLT